MFGPRTTIKILRQLAGFRRHETRPVFCTWHITSHCNLRCRHCFFRHRMRDLGEDLETAACLEIADQLAAERIPVVYFAGGEPTSRADLVRIAHRVRQNGIFTILFTNGTLITPELAGRLAEAFNAVYVSIDGPKGPHERVRGNGVFERSLRGLRNVLVYRGRIRVGVNTVVDADSAGELSDLLRLADAYGVDGVQVHPEFEPQTRLDAAQRDKLLDQLVSARRAFPRLVEVDEEYLRGAGRYLSAGSERECEAHSLLHIAILPDAKVSACCAYPAVVGDLRTEPLAQVLGKGRPDASRFAECPGCFRRDYRTAREAVERPWSVVRRAGTRLLADMFGVNGGGA